MRIKGHGVQICSNHPGAVPNLYILEKVRPVYHYSSKTHRRLAYLNGIILDSTCLFPTGIGTSDPSPQLNYKAQTELLIGHRSQMEQSGLSRNRAPEKSSIWSKCAKKRKQICGFVDIFNCYSLALESQKIQKHKLQVC